jgi:DNA-binding NarL/FixJ family response regulator
MTQKLTFNPDHQLIEVGFSLSPRLVEVLALRLRQYSNTEIAEVLVIEPETVTGHVKRLYETLGIHSRRELFAWAETAGLVSLSPRLKETSINEIDEEFNNYAEPGSYE